MDFYLQDLATGRAVHFPVNPEEIRIQADTQSDTFRVLDLGEISLPRGRRATRYSWPGFLPGAARAGQPYMAFWRPPKDILFDLETWHGENARLRFMVTETEINKDVYIESLRHTWGKGSAFGDLEYEIELVEYRPLVVRIDEPLLVEVAAADVEAVSRPSPPVPTTYTVQSGDTLWAIAKRCYGDGSRWHDIYEANAVVIGPDPNLITPGMELAIPGGEAGSWPPVEPVEASMGNVHLWGDVPHTYSGMGDVHRYGD